MNNHKFKSTDCWPTADRHVDRCVVSSAVISDSLPLPTEICVCVDCKVLFQPLSLSAESQ